MAENDQKGRMDPWQLITILVIVLVVLAGQYMLNQTLNTRMDTLQRAVESNADINKLNIQALTQKIDANNKMTLSSVKPIATNEVETAGALEPDSDTAP